jgi:hypothetical protein
LTEREYKRGRKTQLLILELLSLRYRPLYGFMLKSSKRSPKRSRDHLCIINRLTWYSWERYYFLFLSYYLKKSLFLSFLCSSFLEPLAAVRPDGVSIPKILHLCRGVHESQKSTLLLREYRPVARERNYRS